MQSTRWNNSRFTARSGLTLFEVLLATTILGLSVASVTQIVFNGARAGTRARQEVIAEILCASRLEEWLKQAARGQTGTAGIFPENRDWAWTIRQLPADDPALVLVTVTVEHRSPGRVVRAASQLVRRSTIEPGGMK